MLSRLRLGTYVPPRVRQGAKVQKISNSKNLDSRKSQCISFHKILACDWFNCWYSSGGPPPPPIASGELFLSGACGRLFLVCQSLSFDGLRTEIAPRRAFRSNPGIRQRWVEDARAFQRFLGDRFGTLSRPTPRRTNTVPKRRRYRVCLMARTALRR